MMDKLLLIGLLVSAEAPANERVPVVAVFDIENETDLSGGTLNNLTDYLRVKLSETKTVRVVDKGEQEREQRSLLQAQREESYGVCYDEGCQIPLGKELAADKILRGRIVQFGNQYLLTMEMVDLVTGTSVNGASDRSGGSEAELLASVDHVVETLTGVKPEEPTTYVSRLELVASGAGSLGGVVFSDDTIDWTLGGSFSLRVREHGWLWAEGRLGGAYLESEGTSSAAARIELSQWLRVPLWTGEQRNLLPSDRGSLGIGVGGFGYAPGGVGGFVAGQLDLLWFTGRLALTLDTATGGPGIELTGGLRIDLPLSAF